MNQHKLKTPSFYDSTNKVKNININKPPLDFNTDTDSITPSKLSIINQEDLYEKNVIHRTTPPRSNIKREYTSLKDDAKMISSGIDIVNNSSAYTYGKDHAQQFFLSGRNKMNKQRNPKTIHNNDSRDHNVFELGETLQSKQFKRSSTFDKHNQATEYEDYENPNNTLSYSNIKTGNKSDLFSTENTQNMERKKYMTNESIYSRGGLNESPIIKRSLERRDRLKSTGFDEIINAKTNYYKSEIQRLQEHLKKKSSECKGLFAKLNSLQTDYLEKEEDFGKYQSQVKKNMNQLKQTNISLEHRIEHQDNLNRELKDINDKLSQDINSSENLVEELKMKIDTNESIIDELKFDLEKKDCLISEKCAVYDSLFEKFEDRDTECTNLKMKLVDISSEYNLKTDKLLGCEQRMLLENDRIIGLTEELNVIQDNYNKLERENDQNCREYENLKNNFGDQKKMLENLESDYNMKVKENVVLDNELDRQRSLLLEMKEKDEITINEYNRLQMEFDVQLETVKKIQNDLHGQLSNNENLQYNLDLKTRALEKQQVDYNFQSNTMKNLEEKNSNQNEEIYKLSNELSISNSRFLKLEDDLSSHIENEKNLRSRNENQSFINNELTVKNNKLSYESNDLKNQLTTVNEKLSANGFELNKNKLSNKELKSRLESEKSLNVQLNNNYVDAKNCVSNLNLSLENIRKSLTEVESHNKFLSQDNTSLKDSLEKAKVSNQNLTEENTTQKYDIKVSNIETESEKKNYKHIETLYDSTFKELECMKSELECEKIARQKSENFSIDQTYDLRLIKSQNDILNRTQDDYKDTKDLYKGEVISLKAKLENEEKGILVLNDSIIDQQKRFRIQGTELEEKDSELMTLQTVKNQLNVQSEQQFSKINETECELNDIKRKVLELNNEVRVTFSEEFHKKENERNLGNDVKDLINNLKKVIAICENLKRENKEIKGQNLGLSKTNYNGKQQIEFLKDEQTKLLNNITELKSLINDHQKQLINVNDQNSSYEEKIHEFDQVTHNLLCDLKLGNSTKNELEDKVGQITIELKLAETQLEAEIQNNQKVTEELQELKNTFLNLTSRMDSDSRMQEIQKADLTKLRYSKSQMECNFENEQKSSVKYLNKIKVLETENVNLKKHVETLKKDFSSLKSSGADKRDRGKVSSILVHTQDKFKMDHSFADSYNEHLFGEKENNVRSSSPKKEKYGEEE